MGEVVVGLDLSLASTGIAWFNSANEGDWANPKSKGRKGASLLERHQRLYDMRRAVIAALPEGISVAVIESPSFGSMGGMSHERAHLWWAVVDTLDEWGVAIHEVSPKQRAKFGCGNGNGDKKAVTEAVREAYGALFARRIPNNDVADAVALAGIGRGLLGAPVSPLTAAQQQVLRAVSDRQDVQV